MTDQHDWLGTEPSEATNHRGIVGKGSVAMQLGEVAKQLSRVVKSLRPVGMTGQLHAIPWAQVLVDFGFEPTSALLQRLELGRTRSSCAELLHAPIEVLERPFEIEIGRLHPGLTMIDQALRVYNGALEGSLRKRSTNSKTRARPSSGRIRTASDSPRNHVRWRLANRSVARTTSSTACASDLSPDS